MAEVIRVLNPLAALNSTNMRLVYLYFNLLKQNVFYSFVYWLSLQIIIYIFPRACKSSRLQLELSKFIHRKWDAVKLIFYSNVNQPEGLHQKAYDFTIFMEYFTAILKQDSIRFMMKHVSRLNWALASKVVHFRCSCLNLKGIVTKRSQDQRRIIQRFLRPFVTDVSAVSSSWLYYTWKHFRLWYC